MTSKSQTLWFRCVLPLPWNSTTTGPSVGGSVHVSVSCTWSLSRPSLLFHFPSQWEVRALTLMETRHWVHRFYYSSKHTDRPWINLLGLNQAFALRNKKIIMNSSCSFIKYSVIQSSCFIIKSIMSQMRIFHIIVSWGPLTHSSVYRTVIKRKEGSWKVSYLIS